MTTTTTPAGRPADRHGTGFRWFDRIFCAGVFFSLPSEGGGIRSDPSGLSLVFGEATIRPGRSILSVSLPLESHVFCSLDVVNSRRIGSTFASSKRVRWRSIRGFDAEKLFSQLGGVIGHGANFARALARSFDPSHSI